MYTFRLGLQQIEELEEKRNLSIFTIFQKLSPELREAKLKDYSEVIRIGLIGGGSVKPEQAMVLVDRYVDQRPLDESRDVAYAIVLAALQRVHSDELKKETKNVKKKSAKKGSTS